MQIGELPHQERKVVIGPDLPPGCGISRPRPTGRALGDIIITPTESTPAILWTFDEYLAQLEVLIESVLPHVSTLKH